MALASINVTLGLLSALREVSEHLSFVPPPTHNTLCVSPLLLVLPLPSARVGARVQSHCTDSALSHPTRIMCVNTTVQSTSHACALHRHRPSQTTSQVKSSPAPLSPTRRLLSPRKATQVRSSPIRHHCEVDSVDRFFSAAPPPPPPPPPRCGIPALKRRPDICALGHHAAAAGDGPPPPAGLAQVWQPFRYRLVCFHWRSWPRTLCRCLVCASTGLRRNTLPLLVCAPLPCLANTRPLPLRASTAANPPPLPCCLCLCSSRCCTTPRSQRPRGAGRRWWPGRRRCGPPWGEAAGCFLVLKQRLGTHTLRAFLPFLAVWRRRQRRRRWSLMRRRRRQPS